MEEKNVCSSDFSFFVLKQQSIENSINQEKSYYNQDEQYFLLFQWFSMVKINFKNILRNIRIRYAIVWEQMLGRKLKISKKVLEIVFVKLQNDLSNEISSFWFKEKIFFPFEDVSINFRLFKGDFCIALSF